MVGNKVSHRAGIVPGSLVVRENIYFSISDILGILLFIQIRKFINFFSSTDSNTKRQESEKLHRASTKFSSPGIIGIVVGIITGITISSMVVIILLRRRKTYKRGTNGSALSEDSDVRFLTSDEILDFTIARPNDNDET